MGVLYEEARRVLGLVAGAEHHLSIGSVPWLMGDPAELVAKAEHAGNSLQGLAREAAQELVEMQALVSQRAAAAEFPRGMFQEQVTLDSERYHRHWVRAMQVLDELATEALGL